MHNAVHSRKKWLKFHVLITTFQMYVLPIINNTLFHEWQKIFYKDCASKIFRNELRSVLNCIYRYWPIDKKYRGTIRVRRIAGGYILEKVFHWEIWHIVIEILWFYLYIFHIWLMVKCTLFHSYNPTMLFAIYKIQ